MGYGSPSNGTAITKLHTGVCMNRNLALFSLPANAQPDVAAVA